MTPIRTLTRSLMRQPGNVAVLAVVLGIAIGTTTAVFAVFNYLLFRPIPGVSDEARLVTVVFRPDGNRRATAFGYLNTLPALRQAPGIERLAALIGDTYAIEAAGSSGRHRVEVVTSSFFSTLGLRPSLGRLFTDEEADRSVDVAVVSERFWRTRLDSMPLDRNHILVNRVPFAVVGVVAEYQGWGIARVGETDVWVPISASRLLDGQIATSASTFVARTDGSPAFRVELSLQQVYRAIAVDLPARVRPFIPTVEPGLYSPGVSLAAVRRLYDVLTLMGAFVVLIGAVIAATLFVTRLSGREHEVAVRLALGGDRKAVAGSVLLEAIAISIFGWITGVAIAFGLLRLLRGVQILSSFPSLDAVPISATVLAYSGVAATALILVFVAPAALRVIRLNIREALTRTTPTVSLPGPFRTVSVVAQASLALALVAGAVAINISTQNLLASDKGFDPERVIVSVYRRTEQSASLAVTHRLAAAGFAPVGWSSPAPLARWAEPVRIGSSAEEIRSITLAVTSVSENYFDVLGVRFTAGRSFAVNDTTVSRDAQAVINDALSLLLFGTVQSIGRSFHLERSVSSTSSDLVVIGVVHYSGQADARRPPAPQLFHLGSSAFSQEAVLVRTDPAHLGDAQAAIQGVLQEPQFGGQFSDPFILAESVESAIATDRALARVSSLTAWISLVLALVGVYAVVSQNVLQRKREIGIRSALGATPIIIARHILAETVLQLSAATVIGLAMYAIGGRVIAGSLYEVGLLSFAPIGGGVIVVFAAGAIGALLPTIRATRIPPTDVMRQTI